MSNVVSLFSSTEIPTTTLLGVETEIDSFGRVDLNAFWAAAVRTEGYESVPTPLEWVEGLENTQGIHIGDHGEVFTDEDTAIEYALDASPVFIEVMYDTPDPDTKEADSSLEGMSFGAGRPRGNGPTIKELAAEAKEAGHKTFTTPEKPCRKCGGIERAASDMKCVACKSQKDARWREANREYCSEYYRQYRRENHEARLEYDRRYYQENREARLEYNRQFHQENREYARQYRRENREAISEYYRQYRRENRDRLLAYGAKYRATKLERSLSGVDEDAVNLTYTWATNANEFLGESGFFHVDHTCPLANFKTISGLHTDANLSIITATENLSKGNSFTPFVEIFDSEGEVIDFYESPFDPDTDSLGLERTVETAA